MNVNESTNTYTYATRAGVEYIDPALSAQAPKTEQAQGTDFSKMLQDALSEELTERAVTLSSPEQGLSALNQPGSGLESMLLASAASGTIDDTQLALFMMMVMMQGDESGLSNMLMPVMSTLLGQMEGTQAAASGTADLRLASLSGSGASSPSIKSADGSISLPHECWKPASVPVTGTAGNRSAEQLNRVIQQFDVESAERYRPYKSGSDTYCNIFVWDVSAALGAEIPHYVEPKTGAPMQYPNVKGASELGANATYDWLLKHGETYGWREVSAQEAQAYANAGHPAVTSYQNKNGPGHVQIVCPSKDGTYNPQKGVTVAQAGAKNREYAYITSTLSKSQLSTVRYFVHA